MNYIIAMPEFRHQYVSSLLSELQKTGIDIKFLKVSIFRKINFKKKTIIISDKISFLIIILIIIELLKITKLNIWFVLWNGERDKKIFAYRFLYSFKFAISFKTFVPFYPSYKEFSFLPISKPRVDDCLDFDFIKNKIVFIGELFQNLNDILVDNVINSKSWFFANEVFNGNEYIENLNTIFACNTYEEWVTINRIRYLYIKKLSQEFDNFILIGDDFLNLNFSNTLPTKHLDSYRQCIYKNSLLNIDFLSKSTFSPVYPRSIECLSLNSNFLQLKTKIFENIFEHENMILHTFMSYNELEIKIKKFLENDNYFNNSTVQEKYTEILNKTKQEYFI